MARVLAALFGGIMLASMSAVSLAADVPYDVFVDGRPVDAARHSGLNRDGIVYVNVVRAVKTFSGLLTFGRAGEIRVSIGGRIILFTLGKKTALLDGHALPLSGAPFRRSGDTFVPLAPVAMLANATLQVDRQSHRAFLKLGSSEGFAQPEPTSSEQRDVRPSPAQALTIVTSATTESDGLHARVEISNTTANPYTLDFPTSAQIAFVVFKNGTEVWNSTEGEHRPEPSSLTIEARGSKTVTGTWPGFARLGAGRYTLRTRLLTAVPLDTAPISLGAPAPTPLASS